MLVAVYAGIRCASVLIFADKMVDNTFFKAGGKIKRMMLNAKLSCYLACIYDILALFIRCINPYIAVAEHLNGSTNYFVTLLLQE